MDPALKSAFDWTRMPECYLICTTTCIYI